MDAHRKHLAHTEMVQAQTTAAIINYAFSPPETPVQPSDLCFNHWPPKPVDAQQKKSSITEDELIDWQARVENLAAEMKAGGGPMLDEINNARL